MSHRTAEAPRRELIARWCTLAEQRLHHLTEMFESGRWRRFYTETAFLENIKEAKFAVETWRSLLNPVPPPPMTPELVQGVAAVELALSDSAVPLSARSAGPDPAPIVPEVFRPLKDELLSEQAQHDAVEAAPPQAMIDMLALEQALDVSDVAFDVGTIEARYPVLRNAL